MKNYKRKLILNSIYIIIAIVTEPLSAVILSNILGKVSALDLLIKQEAFINSAVIFNKIVTFIFVNILFRMKQYSNKKSKYKISFLFGTIPVISTAILYLFLKIMMIKNGVSTILYLTVMVGMLLINIIVFQLFDLHNIMDHEILEKKLIKQELRYKDDYYRFLEENHKEIRNIRHNLKNQQIAILQLVEDGECGAAADAVRNIISNIDHADVKVYTQNSTMNAILNNKINLADKFGILVKTDIKVPSKLKINAIDLGIILGNLMDNAIEACQKCETAHRFIEVTIGYHKENLLIDIKNSKPDTIENKILETSKKDKMNHGFGLSSVREIIKKYYGTLDIIVENLSFDVRILINEE